MRFIGGAVTVLLAGSAQAATWTVNQVGDAGDGVCDQTCTLRDAVAALAENDRVLFALGLPNPLLIELTGPALVISVPARVTATDGVPTTIRRTAGVDRLLYLQNGADVRVVGLGFENGVAPVLAAGGPGLGGAIYVEAAATLECRQCVFAHNRAIGQTALGVAPPGSAGPGAAGGAIDAEGTLLIDGGSFFDNRAIAAEGVSGTTFFVPGGNGGSAFGGAIVARASVDILNSTFYDNQVLGGNGGSGGSAPAPPGFSGGNGGSAFGGAVYFAPGSSATVAFSTFAQNAGTPGTGGAGGPNGGANGLAGNVVGAAISADANSVLNASIVFAHASAACGGMAPTQRTSNRVEDSSCPGLVLTNLGNDLEPIDLMHPSPAFVPKLFSRVVDTSPDCLDAPALEAVVLDQRLESRPRRGGGPGLACDFGAIEYSEVMLADGFEDPLPPP